MPWSLNATFLVTVRCGDAEQQAIYKPVRGERPLWDFEPGLHRRELAAYRAQRAARARRGAADGGPRRPVRRGVVAVVRRRRPHRALLHDPRAPTRPPRPAALDRRARPASPTTPTARAGTACSPATACGRSTTGCASRAVQAAHRDLGVRRRADRRGRARRASRARRRRCRWSWRRCSTTTRWRRCSTGRPSS